MANKDSTNIHAPKDKDYRKECLFDSANHPVRFTTNKATPNHNQDRRTVEQWQLDGTNSRLDARVDELASHISNQQDEISQLKRQLEEISKIIGYEAVYNSVEAPDATEQKAVRGRSSPCLQILFILAIIVGIKYLVYHLFSDDYVEHYMDRFDRDYPRFG